MRKIVVLLLMCTLFVVFASCNKQRVETVDFSEDSTDIVSDNDFDDVEKSTLSLTIVELSDDGNIVLAGEHEFEVYEFNIRDVTVMLDGKKTTFEALEAGMKIVVILKLSTKSSVRSDIELIQAFSRGTKDNPYGQMYDLCGLYLKVLEDLWEVDGGLNNDIEYISVDLENAPGGLTDAQKKAIAIIFARGHNVKKLQLSYDELVKQGYINEGELCWKNGILFSINNSMEEDTLYFGLKVIEFDASKWRSGLGAYFFGDCKASFSQNGTWSDYNIGTHAIA